MTDSTLRNTYDRIRREGVPDYALQGYVSPQFDGTARPLSAHEEASRASRYPYDGIGAAAYALRKARERQRDLAHARAEYEAAAAIRDACKAAADRDALRVAESKLAATLKATAAARGRCSAPSADYGAGTWQGADVTRDTAAPWGVPPAMREGATARRYARHMHNRPDPEGGPHADSPGRLFFDHDAGAFRNMTDAADVSGARIDHNGWYADSDYDALCKGVVVQLVGRKGRARYLAAYQFTHCDGGPTIDAGRVFTADGREESDAADAMADAARAADKLAETAAEKEREYQAAWGAGQAWRDAGERLAAIRADVRAILAERRAALGRLDIAGLSALCDAIRARVDSLLDERRELQDERATLADGESDVWGFYPDKAARTAFCDGADLAPTAAPF